MKKGETEKPRKIGEGASMRGRGTLTMEKSAALEQGGATI
jgi:hypothetical protein